MAKKIQIHAQADMKMTNMLTIFQLLYDKTPISRADLAKLSGMSPTSITRFVNNMLELNLIRETLSEEKKVGRTATMLTINETLFYSVGISIDSTYIHVSILNFRKQTVADCYQKMRHLTPTFEQVLDIAYQLYEEALSASGLHPSQICGIGMSVAGVMHGSDILECTAQLKWKGLNIRRAVMQRFQKEIVIVENDCNAAILGQCILHPEYREKRVACICIGSGVGSAVSYQGTLFSQTGGVSFSEIGHTIVEPGGMLCDCGNRGCLQTFMAENSLITRAQKYNPEITLMEEIHSAWVKEIPWARELIQTACTYAKVGINNIACVYNPEIVLVCGESIDTYWDMFETIAEEPQYLFEPFQKKLQIIPFFKMYRSSIIGVSQQVQYLHLKELLKSIL